MPDTKKRIDTHMEALEQSIKKGGLPPETLVFPKLMTFFVSSAYAHLSKEFPSKEDEAKIVSALNQAVTATTECADEMFKKYLPQLKKH